MWIRPRGRRDSASRRLPAALSARPGAVPAAAAALSPRGGRCWGGRCAAPGARLPAAPAASAPRTAASPAHERPRPEVRAPPRAPGPLPPGSRHPAGQRRALVEGPARAAKAQLSLLKRTGVVGNRTRHPGRYLGPIKVGGGWPLAWVQHGRGPEKVGAQTSSLQLSYILDLSCELEVGIRDVGVPSSLQFHFLPPTAPSLVSINQQMGLLELGDITQSHFHVVFISVKNPFCCSLFPTRSPRMRWRCPCSDLAPGTDQQHDP